MTKVSHVVEQINIVCKLKKMRTTVSYPRPTDDQRYDLSVLVISDASRTDENNQLGVITGLLVGEMQQNAISHALSWISHKCKRPFKSVPAAEILVAAEGIDEGKVVAKAYSELRDMDTKVRLCVDLKDMFTSLSTQRNAMNRPFRGDVGCIRFVFQTGAVEKISWIPEKVNQADPPTKNDNALANMLLLPLLNDRLCLEIEDVAETKSSDKNFG